MLSRCLPVAEFVVPMSEGAAVALCAGSLGVQAAELRFGPLWREPKAGRSHWEIVWMG